jgi:hypothetical protein
LWYKKVKSEPKIKKMCVSWFSINNGDFDGDFIGGGDERD